MTSSSVGSPFLFGVAICLDMPSFPFKERMKILASLVVSTVFISIRKPSLLWLGIETIDRSYLHRFDTDVGVDERVGARKELWGEGRVRFTAAKPEEIRTCLPQVTAEPRAC